MLVLLADTTVHLVEARGWAVGWGTLSLINAGLAQSKRRSGLAWWFFSLFIGPLATLLIVAVLDDRPHDGLG